MAIWKCPECQRTFVHARPLVRHMQKECWSALPQVILPLDQKMEADFNDMPVRTQAVMDDEGNYYGDT